MLIKYDSTGTAKWAKTIDGTINAVSETSDGGYIIGGSFSDTIDLGNGVTLTSNTSSSDGMVIKYDSKGTAEWATNIGGSSNDYIKSLAQTNDGGYIVGGSFKSSTINLENGVTLENTATSYSDGMIIKLDSTGKAEWAKAIGGERDEEISTVCETSDGGYIVGGYFNAKKVNLEDSITLINSNQGTSYTADGMIIKYDNTGKLEWAKAIGGNYNNDTTINSVSETSDGDYIMSGSFESSTVHIREYIKGISLSNTIDLDLIGNLFVKFKEVESLEPEQITKQGIAIGATYNDRIETIVPTSDGGYIVGGSFSGRGKSIDLGNEVILTGENSGASTSNGMIIKYDSIGKVEWAKALGISIYAICETSDRGYIVGGSFGNDTIDLGNGVTLTNENGNGMIIKYDSKGTAEWAKVFKGGISAVYETSDGGCIAGGSFSGKSIVLGNGVTLINKDEMGSSSDGMIIKYDSIGKVEWATNIGGSSNDYINSLAQTNDGGYIVGGYFYSATMDLGNGVVLTNNNYYDGLIIKYNSIGTVEWAKVIGGDSNDYINSLAQTNDGGYIVGGYFRSNTIYLENGVTLTKNDNMSSYEDGMIIKYDRKGIAEWAKTIGGSNGDDNINTVFQTNDGGYIVGGYFNANTINLENGIELINTRTTSTVYTSDGMLIKYDDTGKAECATVIGEDSNDSIKSVIQTSDGNYIVGGEFCSRTINLESNVKLNNNSSSTSYSDVMLIKIAEERGAQEVQELIVENEIKEFSITTSVNAVDEVKGGIISGEDTNPYEKVKYGGTSTSEIKMTPNEGYEIIKVTVNGQEWKFKDNLDTEGNYTMPFFQNVTENKHVEVTFAKIDSRIIINKVDSETGEGLAGAEFNIDLFDPREKSEIEVEKIIDNGQEYATGEMDMENKYPMQLSSNNVSGPSQASQYQFIEEDGEYVPEISKTYLEGHTTGIGNTTAYSMYVINLVDKPGKYVVQVDVEISSEENADYGFATISTSSSTPSYDKGEGRFIYISGEVGKKTYTTEIEGGQTYFLFLGYYKNGSVDSGNDQFAFNNVKVSGPETVVLNGPNQVSNYKFVEKDGKYIPEISKPYQIEKAIEKTANTTAMSKYYIYLSGKPGKYIVQVDAEISSEENGDYGFAIINTSYNSPTYDTEEGRFINISGEVGEKTYTMELEGGQTYYLYLGYHKNESVDSGKDQFVFKNVRICGASDSILKPPSSYSQYKFVEKDGKYVPDNSKTYQTEKAGVETNGISYTTANSSFYIDLYGLQGKYYIVVNAKISSEENGDYGYAYIDSSPRFMEISGEVEAKDYICPKVLEGGRSYYLYLGYSKNGSVDAGEDQLVVNSIKIYRAITEKYGFVQKEGEESVCESNNEGKDNTVANSYIPIDLTGYSGKYNLQVNAEISTEIGDYGYAIISKSKYSSAPSYSSTDGRFIYITGEVKSKDYISSMVLEGGQKYYLYLGYYKDGTTNTEETLDKFTINKIELLPNGEDLYHTKVTTNSDGQGITEIPFGKYVVTEKVAPEGYILDQNARIIEFNEDGDHEFEITNEKAKKVIVHHKNVAGEQIASDDILEGKTGDIYTAVPHLDLEEYELKVDEEGKPVMEGDAKGTFQAKEQEVTYYYEGKKVPLIVHHYVEGTNDRVELRDGKLAEDIITTAEIGTEYTTEALTEGELSEKYELSKTPSNQNGRYEKGGTEVTYCYRVKQLEITTKVETHKEQGETGEEIDVRGGRITGEGYKPYEAVNYGEDSNEEIIATPEEGYEVKSITINGAPQKFMPSKDRTVTLDKFHDMIENKEVAVVFGQATAKVIVHHYIENTSRPVPMKDGEDAPDDIIEGAVGDVYSTKEKEGISSIFELAEKPEKTIGQMTEEPIELKYFYKQKEVEPELEGSIEKTGPGKVTSKEAPVYYEIEFNGVVNYFLGKARITIVDTLPYAIDKDRSELAGGTYDEVARTITWVIEENVGTFTTWQEKTLAVTKAISLYYDYTSSENETNRMSNEIKATVDLLKSDFQEPEQFSIVKTKEIEGDPVDTSIEIPAEVIVHHYIYNEEAEQDEEKYTKVEIIEPETKEGIVGAEYTTSKSEDIPGNYECIDDKPKGYSGTYTETPIEVSYYYRLLTPSIEKSIKKEVISEKNEEGEVVLTREDEEVEYKITHNVTVREYVGKVTIKIVDKLPAKIDLLRSSILDGAYDEDAKTITWTKEVEVDTYRDGDYQEEIVKEITLVYKEQNMVEDLVNEVKGEVVTYYPEGHLDKENEEFVKEETQDEVTVKQDYRVNFKVVKVWDDNEDARGRRPDSVNVKIEVGQVEGSVTEELNEGNDWTYEAKNLPKYNKATGEKITYIVTEEEAEEKDLEYYKEAVITNTEIQTDEVTNYNYTITNSYNLRTADLNTEISKTGTEEITSREDKVNYTINFSSEISNYVGEGTVTIVDTLPYLIDEDNSELDGGKYDEETNTITWTIELEHINTDTGDNENDPSIGEMTEREGEEGKVFVINIVKEIELSYKDVDLRKEKMTNTVKGRVELKETDEVDEKTSEGCDTNINVQGKVIVRYINKDTGIELTDKCEISGKIGSVYKAEIKEFYNCDYIDEGKATGIIEEGEKEIILYYTKAKLTVIAEYQDREGNSIEDDVVITGYLGDPYKTEQKEIENYRLVEVIGEPEGVMAERKTIVRYVYEKIPAQVIVRYLTRVETEDENGEIQVEEKEIVDADIINGYVGDSYLVSRKVIPNYKASEPEPSNVSGKMTEETIEVKYYYERIPSGVLTVKYMDIETKREIDSEKYGYEIKGYVGDEYETEFIEIPYYVFVESTSNTKGILTEMGDTVIYYYRKQVFNFSIAKTIGEVKLNGKEVKVTNNQLMKVELKPADIKDAELIVKYKIRVTNEGELAGKVKVVDRIPKGFEFVTAPEYWKENANGEMETQVQLEAGESKDLILELRWINKEENLGAKANTAEIISGYNAANFDDTNGEDNLSTATIVVSIKTGWQVSTLIIITIIISMMITAYLMIILIKTSGKGPYIKDINFLHK